MYQSDMLRSGPMGPLISGIRDKFLIQGPISLTEQERGFLIFSLNDILTTSHSSVVKSQLGTSMQLLRPDTERRIKSQINQEAADLSGTYDTEWQVMQSCLTKLGIAAAPPAQPLKVGPDGDPNAISTPMEHDRRDGTGYNNT